MNGMGTRLPIDGSIQNKRERIFALDGSEQNSTVFKFDDPVRTQTHRNPVGLRFYRIPGLRIGFFSNRPTKQC